MLVQLNILRKKTTLRGIYLKSEFYDMLITFQQINYFFKNQYFTKKKFFHHSYVIFETNMTLNIDPIYFPHLPFSPVLILLLFRREKYPGLEQVFPDQIFGEISGSLCITQYLMQSFNLILFWFVWGGYQSLSLSFKRFQVS